MGGGLSTDCGRKNMGFSAPFEAFSGIKNAIGFSPWRNQIMEFFFSQICLHIQAVFAYKADVKSTQKASDMLTNANIYPFSPVFAVVLTAASRISGNSSGCC